jgi:hypothetical protein
MVLAAGRNPARRQGLLEEKKVNEKTRFQDLKATLEGGRCESCNGYTRVTAGSRNILVLACDHATDMVRRALTTRVGGAAITERRFAGENPAQGGWSGSEFKIAKAVR